MTRGDPLSIMRRSRGNANSGNSEMENHPTSVRSSPARGTPTAKLPRRPRGRPFAVAGIEPDQIADDDVETGLLARLSRRRPLNGFTALDEASRKAPLARLAGAWSSLPSRMRPSRLSRPPRRAWDPDTRPGRSRCRPAVCSLDRAFFVSEPHAAQYCSWLDSPRPAQDPGPTDPGPAPSGCP